jgi:hypothetical protein
MFGIWEFTLLVWFFSCWFSWDYDPWQGTWLTLTIIRTLETMSSCDVHQRKGCLVKKGMVRKRGILWDIYGDWIDTHTQIYIYMGTGE